MIGSPDETTPATSDGWRVLAESIKPHLVGELQADEGKVQAMVDEAVKAMLPDRIEVDCGKEQSVRIDRSHKALKEVIGIRKAGFNNLYLVGPAGTGKTTLARQFAEAFATDFGCLSMSAGVSETHILGRVLPQSDGEWRASETDFIRIYSEGGVFLLDEMDNTDPNVLVQLNAALANGFLVNPITGKTYNRHPDTVIICAANTYGNGPDAQYVGRNQLDAATLDRFIGAFVEIDYDRSLERAIAREILPVEDADEVIEWIKAVRKAIKDHRLRKVASTRMLEAACKHRASGTDMKQVIKRMLIGWSKEATAKIEWEG